jgi:hypothetical protein
LRDASDLGVPAVNRRTSQLLRDLFELVDGPTQLARQGTDDIIKAMNEVILEQGLLCFLDRMQLLGDIEARPAGLDHLDNAA